MKLILKAPQHKMLKSLIWKITTLLIGLACFFKVYKEAFHLYLTPQEVLRQHPIGLIRVGGVLSFGSLLQDQEKITFILTDSSGTLLPVHFYGTPPRLLREEQDTVVFGSLQNGIFVAQEVLAKHDEYYRPKP